MQQVVRVYRLRSVVIQGPDGKPARVARSEWWQNLSIEADSVDEGRGKARAEILRVTGKEPRSISSLLGGGFSAIVPE